jgi:hypothetical protein
MPSSQQYGTASYKACRHAIKAAILRTRATLLMCLGQGLELTKTTLRLPRELVKELKRIALETDRSLQQVAREALEEYMRRHQKHA